MAYEVSGTTTLIELADTVSGRVTSRGGDLTGSIGSDRLVGRSGSNDLSGGGSSDVLRGKSGADVLTGGFGDDYQFGGSGGDRFVFGRGDGFDRIGDFEEADTIDLSTAGAVFSDLTIVMASRTRTVVTLDDDLSIALRHHPCVAIDPTDFVF